MKNFTEYGYNGANFSEAMKAALAAEPEVYIPSGNYTLTEPLIIPSRRKIAAAADAVIKAADGRFSGGDYRACISNDYDNQNCENISISGGVWDGNNAGNARGDWRHGPCTGVLFGFYGVKGLNVSDLTVKNSETYHFILSRVTDFTIENVVISDENKTLCQDGVHLGGGCRRGAIRNIIAENGATNDDLIAFNADDAYDYRHNHYLFPEEISDITVDNVIAENCWTAVRMLSVEAPIRNVTVKNLIAGVREMGLNFDATRYAGDRIFDPAAYPGGVGNIENVRFENVVLWKTRDKDTPLCVIESNCRGVVFENFARNLDRDVMPGEPFFRFDNLAETAVYVDGETTVLSCGERKTLGGGSYRKITVDRN